MSNAVILPLTNSQIDEIRDITNNGQVNFVAGYRKISEFIDGSTIVPEDMKFWFRQADDIQAGQGRDWVSAGAGDDVVDGGLHDDHLFGDSGADTLSGGAGDDVVDGGHGFDIASYETLITGMNASRFNVSVPA